MHRVGPGLVFFRPGTSRAYKRRRIIFAVVLATAAASLVWPVYAAFSAARPFVFGLPLSLAWIVTWQIIMMSTSIWLYRSE